MSDCESGSDSDLYLDSDDQVESPSRANISQHTSPAYDGGTESGSSDQESDLLSSSDEIIEMSSNDACPTTSTTTNGTYYSC